jgi:SAM-dependent methyltransferase
MPHEKFDVRKLERLNDPGRFESLDPVRMWGAIGMSAPREIVEIGAGTALFASRFAALAPGAVVYAADIEPIMVEWMRANRPEVGEGHVVPILSTETRVPLDDGIADVVVMINLHHELADPAATYAEAHRLLRGGGTLLVVDWAPGETEHGPPQAVRATAEALSAAMEGAGLAAVTVHAPLKWHSMLTGVKE